MGLQSAIYSWGSVKALNSIVLAMNLAGIVALGFTIIWAIRFERGFGDYLNLVSSGTGHLWTAVIVVAAIVCAPGYVLGIKPCLYLKFESARGELEDRQIDENEDANRLLFFHAIVCLASGFLVAILNAACLMRSSIVQLKSRNGLIEAIEKYGNDSVSKTRVDAVQTELKCCGDESYEDWFHVPWMKLSTENSEDEEKSGMEEQSEVEENKEAETTSADVPFSCCSNDIPKPCVHHDILTPSAIYNYDPKHLTIATSGCRLKITNRGKTIRFFLVGYFVLLSIYQIILSLFSRLLQTAHSNEFYIGPQKTRYHVWIFCKGRTSSRSLLPQNVERVKSRRVRSKRTSSVSSSDSSSGQNEIELKKSKANLLERIHSKISSIKSKSLPLIRPKAKLRRSRSSRETDTRRSSYKDREDDEQRSNLRNQKEIPLRKLSSSRRYGSLRTLSKNSNRNLPPAPLPPVFSTKPERKKEENISAKHPSKSLTALESAREELATKKVSRNSGRRRKVLEKFGAIWRDTAQEERIGGGADGTNNDSSKPKQSPRLNRSARDPRYGFESIDSYNRFRGTLRHILARRETVQARMKQSSKPRVYSPRIRTSMDTRRSNLLARLRCNNVPPSYRLIANFGIEKHPTIRTSPPTPPPPPTPPDPWTCSAIADRARSKLREQGQCSICNRPVERVSGIYRRSDIDWDGNTPASSVRCLTRRTETFSRLREHSREDSES